VISRDPLVLFKERIAGLPPPSLTPAAQLRVRFAGERGGEGPVTVGQESTLAWISNPAFYTRMIEWPLSLPAGTTFADITVALEILMARHESLRTSYPAPAAQAVPAGREPAQRVARSGELMVDVYEAGEEPADEWVLIMELTRRLRSREFDTAADLPLRVAVASWRGVPTAAVVVYSHMAVDFASMALIDRQFMSLLSDSASRKAGPLGHQPLDQAADERSVRSRGRLDAALRAWEAHLRDMPQCLYAVPSADPGRSGGLVSGWLWSRAAALALPHIAARTGASRQLVVFAALCVVMAWRTGHEACVMPVASSNRYQRHLREYVGTLAQDCIVSVDVSDRSLDAVVRHTAAAVLRGNRNGLVEIPRLQRVVRRVENDRGFSYARYCVFNDLSTYLGDAGAGEAGPDPAAAGRALPESRFARLPSPSIEELLLCQLQQVDGEMLLGVMTRDANRVSPAEIEALLRGVESLLVAAAPGDADLSRLAEITNAKPIARGPGWLRVGSSWIDMAEVRRLLDDALATPSAVFAVPDSRGEPSLTGYLAAGNGIGTPERAHAACMRVLGGTRALEPPDGIRYTAMAPARYVICVGAPADLGDFAAWRRQPVLASGDGRSGSTPGSRLAMTGPWIS
jgi:hypothetical protein